MSSLFGGESQTEVSANNRVSRANAIASNKVRAATNKAARAEGSLARWIQSVNNNSHLEAGGKALAASQGNFTRSVDAAKQKMFSQDIAEAEQRGMAAVSQARSGTSGSVADNINTATALRDAMGDQIQDDRLKLLAHDQRARMGSIASQMIGGLDSSTINDAIDYGIDVPTIKRVKGTWEMFVGNVVRMGASWVTAGASSALAQGGQSQPTKGNSSGGANTSGYNDRRFDATMSEEAEKSTFTFDDEHDYGAYL